MNTLLKEISNSSKPVVRIIRKTDTFKVIAIGLNKGVALKNHKAPGRTKLLVLNGSITYQAAEKEMVLSQFDEFEIPLGELHQVTGNEISVIMLVVG